MCHSRARRPGEGLARHVHPAIDGEANPFPSGNAAGQQRNVGVAAFGQPSGGALGQALTGIADDDRRRPPWQQARRQQLQPAQWQARRHQQVALVKAPLLARIDDRDLTARLIPPPQLRWRNAAGHSRPPPVPLDTVCPNSRQASKSSHRAAATQHPERNTTKVAFFCRGTPISASVAARHFSGLGDQIRYLADQSNINRILPPNNEFARPIN